MEHQSLRADSFQLDTRLSTFPRVLHFSVPSRKIRWTPSLTNLISSLTSYFSLVSDTTLTSSFISLSPVPSSNPVQYVRDSGTIRVWGEIQGFPNPSFHDPRLIIRIPEGVYDGLLVYIPLSSIQFLFSLRSRLNHSSKPSLTHESEVPIVTDTLFTCSRFVSSLLPDWPRRLPDPTSCPSLVPMMT